MKDKTNKKNGGTRPTDIELTTQRKKDEKRRQECKLYYLDGLKNKSGRVNGNNYAVNNILRQVM